ncbi:hypothetical protein [Alicyclobacillus sp. SO9]|uniref:hypothetical protein n=1 Tax=Alicyclobacillus sp. SO9 TaxID=2665646 RepID=UPI0018E82011|nr:hypothetical protein [Alicyclobacillus sp. SO9]QQE77012.1 hypothetical protein GI364_13570 [Alicyclobacillus sp. SO9]
MSGIPVDGGTQRLAKIFIYRRIPWYSVSKRMAYGILEVTDRTWHGQAVRSQSL